jgi:hypothetical protein
VVAEIRKKGAAGISKEVGQMTGVISRAANYLFKEMAKTQKATDCEFNITCNYYEIYKEKLYDLLSDKSIED